MDSMVQSRIESLNTLSYTYPVVSEDNFRLCYVLGFRVLTDEKYADGAFLDNYSVDVYPQVVVEQTFPDSNATAVVMSAPLGVDPDIDRFLTASATISVDCGNANYMNTVMKCCGEYADFMAELDVRRMFRACMDYYRNPYGNGVPF